ncbi:hypothetical protein [Wolbachia endosymbiont (group A) of Myopa testacea]|uniref:hypothetical protein n=1 Tax=Wolbachia endosymbiont (group A) of Myopa testacea TaxID=3066148 RepID=UPI00334123E2
MLPVYYTTITDKEGRSRGFSEDELGEFDREIDLLDFEEALKASGYMPQYLGYSESLVRNLLALKHCVLWNLNQGLFGNAREAQVPALCDLLGIVFTGSGTWTALVTQDKTLSANLVENNVSGIRVAKSFSIESLKKLEAVSSLPFTGPYFIKPRFEGSSRGIYEDAKQHTFEKVYKKCVELLSKWGPVRIEQYINGIDISANLSCKDDGTLVAHEPMAILTSKTIDTATTKSDYLNLTRNITSLKEIYPDKVEFVKSKTLELSSVFRAKHYFRIDLRLDESSGEVYFLETNLTPNFALHDEFVMGAQKIGISFQELLKNISSAAYLELSRNVI